MLLFSLAHTKLCHFFQRQLAISIISISVSLVRILVDGYLCDFMNEHSSCSSKQLYLLAPFTGHCFSFIHIVFQQIPIVIFFLKKQHMDCIRCIPSPSS